MVLLSVLLEYEGEAGMYKETIERLNPKPKFNLTWYKNDDLYSEGDVEDLIINLIAENTPENYTQAIYDNYGWSTYYHLTHLRKNILNWYPFKKESSVLEIGCGLGAITNMLCEKCNDVTAVELSKKRATATLLRCREKENLEIIVGNLNDIEFGKKFDYITLIGVLEYQGQYTETDNPYADFLRTIKKLLKPDGKLLIGIENKYGLKYWCGAKEDHTGIPFDGMNQYRIGNKNAQTFSKKELNQLIKISGFKNTYFYYPMPDYKLPTVIYSEKKLPDTENMQDLQPYYTDKSTLIADEMGMYKDLIENNVFEFFSNSFLVECSDANVGEVSFANISSERLEKYRIITRFRGEDTVEKFALNENLGKEHLYQTIKNQEALCKAGLKVWNAQMEEGIIKSKRSHEQLLENKLLELYKEQNTEEIYAMYDRVYNEILKSSVYATEEDNILYELEIAERNNGKNYGSILKIAYLDMIFRNAFYKGQEIYWFDQEWILENVPAKYVLYYAMQRFYQSYPWVENVVSINSLAEKYDMLSVWQDFKKLEGLFYELVSDEYHFAESQAVRGGSMQSCITNIKKILGID